MIGLTLDDYIFCLQRTDLPNDLASRLVKADIHYLQNNDTFAWSEIQSIQRECKSRGIKIFRPIHAIGIICKH